MNGLSVKGVTKTFRVELPREDALSSARRFLSGRSPSVEFRALDSVSFELAPGTSLALCGPNGSGKTTLLRVLAGITPPSSGSFSFSGRTACLLGFGSILQDRLSVKENARLCAVFFGLGGPAKEAAERLLDAAGLQHLRNARAGELSSGMRLRLPFTAALESSPDLILMDEVLAVGDESFRRRCLSRLSELRRAGAILIFATHDHSLARTFADEAIILESGKISLHCPALAIPEPGIRPAAASNCIRMLDRLPILSVKLEKAGYRLESFSPASDEDLLLAHTPGWLARLKSNDLSEEEERDLVMPYSKVILPLAWKMAGGTLAAARNALRRGLGIFPAGGGHHAFPDRGEGFCPVNDVAVAALRLLADDAVKRPAVIDLDAHQGNGTAFIFSDGRVKTFSAHTSDGYPRNRVRSTMDVDIPSGSTDGVYLPAVKRGVKDFLRSARPDLVFALCPADPYEKDPLGDLCVTEKGLRERDEFLFGALRTDGIPVCLLLGGGYGDPQETARLNFATITAAAGGRSGVVVNC